MDKARRYVSRYLGRSIEMSRANSPTLVYRIPYQNLRAKDEVFSIKNPFIVYILRGKNGAGRDTIYVGKSKNGLKNRPTSHEKKCKNWFYCYVLTQFHEGTFFNDGAIQYLEDRLSKIVDDIGAYENTTDRTNSGTANRNDEEDCEDYLEEALQMLDVLGLDLITHQTDESDCDDDEEDPGEDYKIPDGVYYLKRKLKKLGNKPVEAKMQVSGGRYIVLPDSMVCASEGPGLQDSIILKRKAAMIEDGILKEEVSFKSPSAAGSFVIGASCNGWVNWKDEKGVINRFRKGK